MKQVSEKIINMKKTTEILYYVVIYLLLLLNCGFYIHEIGHIWEFVRFGLAAMFLFLSKWKFEKKTVVAMMAMVIIVSISSFINGDGLERYVVILFDIVGAFFIACGICTEHFYKFIHIFKNLVFTISVFSCIIFFIALINNSALSFFPVVKSGSHITYFCGLSFAYVERLYVDIRNLGIFWEPGVFQIYILLALIAEMFMPNQEKRKTKLLHCIVLIITMITTMSTTGIVAMVMLLCVYSFSTQRKSIGLLIMGLLITSIIFMQFYRELLPESIKFALFDKIADILSGNSELVTVNVRLTSIWYPLKAFLSSPLIGVGGEGMKAWADILGHSMNTCTPLNWLAHYGIFMFAIIVYGFISFGKKFLKTNLYLLVFVIFMFSIFSEPMNYEPTILCISFMGYYYAPAFDMTNSKLKI